MPHITLHELRDIGLEIVFICSIMHTFLPPWDFLNDFPAAQKLYKVFIYLVGYVAINGRSTVYKSISMQTNGGVNEAKNSAAPPEIK